MKALWRNFSWIMSGTAFSTAIRALTLLLLVRWASPAEFALYAGTFGLLVFGKSLSDLGVTKLITRDRALDAKSGLYAHGLRLNTITSVLLGIVGTVGVLAFATFSTSLAWALMPMPIAMALEKNADTWRSVHLADGDAHLVALYTLGRRVTTFLVFISLFNWSGLGPVLSMTFAEFAAAFLSMILVRRSVGRVVILPHKLDIRRTFQASFPYWVHGLAMNVRNLDVSIVALFAPVAQSGYFAAATRLSGPLQLVPSTLASVLLPHSARNHTSERSGAGRVVFSVTLLFTLFCALLAYFVPTLVPILIGDDYKAAILCIQIIILGLPLSVFTNLATAALQGMGLASAVSRVSWMFAIGLLVGVSVGASLAGAEGAAIGTVAAHALLSAMVMWVWFGPRREARGAIKT